MWILAMWKSGGSNWLNIKDVDGSPITISSYYVIFHLVVRPLNSSWVFYTIKLSQMLRKKSVIFPNWSPYILNFFVFYLPGLKRRFFLPDLGIHQKKKKNYPGRVLRWIFWDWKTKQSEVTSYRPIEMNTVLLLLFCQWTGKQNKTKKHVT